MYQKESKQSARKDHVFKTKERESKRFARRISDFKAKETVYQKESKHSSRENPVFKAKEIVYQKKANQIFNIIYYFQTSVSIRSRYSLYIVDCVSTTKPSNPIRRVMQRNQA